MKKFTGLTVMLFVLFIVANVVVADTLGERLELLDNPINMSPEEPWHKLDGAQEIRVKGDYAYIVSTNSNSFSKYDVSNPNNPKLRKRIDHTSTTYMWKPLGLTISGEYAYIVTKPISATNKGKLVVIEIGNNGEEWNYITDLDNVGGRNIVVDGDYAYIAGHSSNTAYIVDISENPPELVKKIDSTLPGLPWLSRVYTLDKEGNYLYIVSDIEETQEALIAKIDVSIPTNPILEDYFEHVQGNDVLYRPVGLVVKGDYAYVVTLNPPGRHIVGRNDTGNALMILNVNTLDVEGKVYIGLEWNESYFNVLGGPEGLVSVEGDYAYVPIWRWIKWKYNDATNSWNYLDVRADGTQVGGIAVVNISNPKFPKNVVDTRFGQDFCSGQAYNVNEYIYCVSFRKDIGAELNIFRTYLP